MPLSPVLLLTLGALLPSALALGLPAPQEQPNAPTPITPTDLAALRQVANLELSPDGNAAIAEVTRLVGDVLDRQGSARYLRELWRFDLNTPGEARQLTFGERAAGQPAISPDGRWLAFIRAGAALPGAKPGEGDDTSGVDLPQVWLLPLDGPGEARQLTRLEFGAAAPRWFPDSQALLVSSSWPAERIEVPAPFLKPGAAPLEQARALQPRPKAESKPEATPADANGWADWLLSGENDADPRRIDRRNFQGEQSLAGPLEVERLSEVRLSGAIGREWKSGWLSLESAALSPDGNALVFCSSYPLDVAPDHSEYHALFLWRLSALEPELLLADERWDLGEPHWSDDGARLFFTLQPTNEPTFGQTRLGTMELSNGAFALLAEDIDAQLAAPAYGGGGLLFFLREREGRTTLMGLDLETRQHRPLVDAAGSVQRFASRGGRIVYALSTASNPCEIFSFDAAKDDPRLSDLHSTWLKQKQVVEPAWHWLERPDASRVQYWLQPPAGRSLESLAEGPGVPLLVEVHGGPHVMWGPGSQSMWHEFQLFSSRGYAVLYANPRGSAGYGRDFQRGNYRDWGPGPASDVLACVEDALARYPALEDGRLFLTGGSYGGYLTAWIVAHDQRFAAAAALRGVYDLGTFFGEGNAFRLVKHDFGGWPFEPGMGDLLDEQSPLEHVTGIQTPLLISHGSEDLRTGVSQSEMLFRSLDLLGRPVEYVRYPEEGHEMTRSGRPARRIDNLVRLIEWFERHDPGPGGSPVTRAPAENPAATDLGAGQPAGGEAAAPQAPVNEPSAAVATQPAEANTPPDPEANSAVVQPVSPPPTEPPATQPPSAEQPPAGEVPSKQPPIEQPPAGQPPGANGQQPPNPAQEDTPPSPTPTEQPPPEPSPNPAPSPQPPPEPTPVPKPDPEPKPGENPPASPRS